MTGADLLPATVLKRKAVVYVRQSTQTQVQINLESQRRQYDLVDEARNRGFRDVEVIDDDLGRSASGTMARPGFDRLVAWLCAGDVGAVLCFDASRLARNGRDWHHLLELCGLVGARVIDTDGIYDPCRPNDRLLLGMKGSISEFELGVIRSRMHDAKHGKALRGDLRISVPIGYIWHRGMGLGLDPSLRVQEAVRVVFTRFRQLSSARQVLLSLTAEQMHFPRPSDGKTMASFDWTPIRYRNIISILKNPFYAGAYAYGKSEKRTTLQMDARVQPISTASLLRGGSYHPRATRGIHRVGRVRAHPKAVGRERLWKGSRCCQVWPRWPRPVGRAFALCRWGRRLVVAYSGHYSSPIYRCERPNQMSGRPRCLTFGEKRVDTAIGHELLLASEPIAIEAALHAEHRYMEQQNEQRRLVEPELQQARYEASSLHTGLSRAPARCATPQARDGSFSASIPSSMCHIPEFHRRL